MSVRTSPWVHISHAKMRHINASTIRWTASNWCHNVPLFVEYEKHSLRTKDNTISTYRPVQNALKAMADWLPVHKGGSHTATMLSFNFYYEHIKCLKNTKVKKIK